MNNSYNDNPILDEEVALKLKRAYDEKLNKVRMQSNENEYLHLAHICVDILNEAKEIILVLQKNSKNLDMKEKLDEILSVINEHLDKLSNLYINESQINKLEFNYNANIKVLIEKLLNYLLSLVQLLEIESNIKISTSLFNLIYQTIDAVKKLNNYIVLCEHKIFSLFNSQKRK